MTHGGNNLRHSIHKFTTEMRAMLYDLELENNEKIQNNFFI